MNSSREMGQVYDDFIFIGPTGTRKTLRLLVDTGSTFSWIREESLHELGLNAQLDWKFTTIENVTITRKIGEIVIEYAGVPRTTVVVFALPSDAEVLGLHALEGLCLEVDPTNRRLKKTDAVLALAT